MYFFNQNIWLDSTKKIQKCKAVSTCWLWLGYDIVSPKATCSFSFLALCPLLEFDCSLGYILDHVRFQVLVLYFLCIFCQPLRRIRILYFTGYWWWSLQIILCVPKGRNWSSRVKEGGLGTTFVCGTMKIRCFCWYNSSETLFYLSLAAQGKLDQIIST